MSDKKIVQAWINPLQFLEGDKPWAPKSGELPSIESVIDFICTPGLETDIDSLVKRYKEISNEKKRLFAAPAEQRVLDKLVWPLRHAKSGYMVGNYLGTIALCGTVAEMIAILIFEISNFSINDRVMTAKDQENYFGSSFEKLGQDRRVKILFAANIITSEIKVSFDRIREIRKKYLHLWSQDHESLAPDSIKAYNFAVHLTVSTIGQDVKDGKLILNPSLVKYLEKSGIYSDETET